MALEIKIIENGFRGFYPVLTNVFPKWFRSNINCAFGDVKHSVFGNVFKIKPPILFSQCVLLYKQVLVFGFIRKGGGRVEGQMKERQRQKGGSERCSFSETMNL